MHPPQMLRNFVPCINSIVIWDTELRKQIFAGMVACRARLHRNTLQKLYDGQTHVKPGRLSLTGVPPWRRVCSIESKIPVDVMLRPASTGPSFFNPVSFRIKCPHCTFTLAAAQRTLYAKGKWSQLRCQQCFILSSARQWKCACGSTWIGCPHHAQVGFACRSRPHNKRPRDPEHDVAFDSVGTRTNELPPPTHNEDPPPKRRVVTKRQQANLVCNSGDASLTLARRPKRAASAAPLFGRAKPKARPTVNSSRASSSTAAIEEIQRLRAARVNPL